MSGDESRSYPRTPIELKVEYSKLNTFFFDYTANISQGGSFIKTPRPLDIGVEFIFKLMVPHLEEPLALKGRVVWIISEGEVTEEHPDPGMGIRFIYETDEARLAVEHRVARLMKKYLGERAYAKLIQK